MRIRPVRSMVIAIMGLLALCGGIVAKAQTLPLNAPTSPYNAPQVPVGPRIQLSLSEAVALGLRDNRTLQSSYLSRKAQRFDLVVANRRFMPRLDIAVSTDRARNDRVSTSTTTLEPTAAWLSPIGTAVQFSWSRISARGEGQKATGEASGVSFSQPLLKGAGLAVNQAPVRIATLQEDIYRLNLKTSVSDTVSNIIFAYRTLVQAQEQERLAQASLARSETFISTNTALVTAGRMASADLIQNQADAANQRVASLQAQQQTNSARLGLLRLLALDLRTNIEAADPIRGEHVEVDLDKAIALGLNGRMDILSQRKVLEQARQTRLVARNNRLWDVSVTGAVQDRRNINTSVGGIDLYPAGTNSTIGLQVKIPFGDYTLKQADVQASVALETAELQLEDLRQAAEAQIRDAVANVETSWRQVEAARQARDLAGQALDFARRKFNAGRASNFEVLSYEAGLRIAENQELAANIGYLNALTALDQQLGTTLDTWHINLND